MCYLPDRYNKKYYDYEGLIKYNSSEIHTLNCRNEICRFVNKLFN